MKKGLHLAISVSPKNYPLFLFCTRDDELHHNKFNVISYRKFSPSPPSPPTQKKNAIQKLKILPHYSSMLL